MCLSTKQLKWFHSFFALSLGKVCHLMTECGDPRVTVRPLWLASTSSCHVSSSCQARHSVLLHTQSHKTHKWSSKSWWLKLCVFACVYVCVCMHAAINRSNSLINKVFILTLAELPQTLIWINLQIFNTKCNQMRNVMHKLYFQNVYTDLPQFPCAQRLKKKKH